MSGRDRDTERLESITRTTRIGPRITVRICHFKALLSWQHATTHVLEAAETPPAKLSKTKICVQRFSEIKLRLIQWCIYYSINTRNPKSVNRYIYVYGSSSRLLATTGIFSAPHSTYSTLIRSIYQASLVHGILDAGMYRPIIRVRQPCSSPYLP